MLEDLIALGWNLTFARPGDKNPGGLMGKGWQNNCATSPEDVAKWLKKCPDANVGVLLGPKSGVIDIEYDSDEGRDILEPLVAESGILTPTYKSAKSIHRIYEWAEFLPARTVQKYKGIEFRLGTNAGAQSILPPSLHPSGVRYEWLPGLSPADVPVASIPFELLSLCDFAASRFIDSDRTEADDDGNARVKQGERHDWMRDRLIEVGRWGLSASQLLSVAETLDDEVAHFDPGDRDYRLRRLVDWVTKNIKPGSKPQDSDRKVHYRTGAITADKLLEKKIERRFIVEDILVESEPMVVGGPTKTLKTSTMLDLAVSIVSGTPFLGEFKVPKPRSVMFISGESGELSIQQTLRDICNGRNLTGADISRLYISYKLPKLNKFEHVDDLIDELKNEGIGIVFIDPLYRSLEAGTDAGNVYAMGAKLELLAEQIQAAGITTILVHHFKKQGKTYDEPPELEDLSQSGIAEFGRQFILLKRREQYQHDGHHTVWFSWGGSAGHQGAKILKAETGVYADGLKWETELLTREEYKKQKSEEKAKAKKSDAAELREGILIALEATPGLNQTALLTAVGGTRELIREVLRDLVDVGEIRGEPGPRNSIQYSLNETPNPEESDLL